MKASEKAKELYPIENELYLINKDAKRDVYHYNIIQKDKQEAFLKGVEFERIKKEDE
tara:strand:- start:1038 stop:1208 length:171 start_codon:yes stop_codon:yes gene_type:complete